MRVSRAVPEVKIHSVEMKRATTRSQGMYHAYLIQPIKIGEMAFDGGRVWVTDDGLEFTYLRDVEKYYQKRLAQQGVPLEPGRYEIDFKEVKDHGDRVVIKTKDGDIVIQRPLG